MTKRLIVLLVALIFCFVLCSGTVLAADMSSAEFEVASDGSIVPTRGDITVTCGMNRVSGNTYEIWGKVRAVAVESLSISVYLYDITGGGNTYIGSASNSNIGTSAEAAFNETLTSGHKYKVTAYGSGNTKSTSTSKTYQL